LNGTENNIDEVKKEEGGAILSLFFFGIVFHYLSSTVRKKKKKRNRGFTSFFFFYIPVLKLVVQKIHFVTNTKQSLSVFHNYYFAFRVYFTLQLTCFKAKVLIFITL
jgi:hypothetical protein